MTHLKHDGLDLQQFPASDPKIRAWAAAMEMGFHGIEPPARHLDVVAEAAVQDGFTATALYDPEPRALKPDMPVATFGVFRSTTNLGADLVDTGMLTAATVRPSFKRRGILRRMMELNLSRLVDDGAALALLTASSAAIYGRFGFQSIISVASIEVNPERFKLLPGAAENAAQYRVDWVLRDKLIEVTREVNRVAHESQRGSTRRHRMFEVENFIDPATDKLDEKLRTIVCFGAEAENREEPVGYVLYTLTDFGGELEIKDMNALTYGAELALWQHLGQTEGLSKIICKNFSLESPLRSGVVDERAISVTRHGDYLWARVLDPVQCFEARSYSWAACAARVSVTFEVTDPLGHIDGIYRLSASESGAEMAKLTAPRERVEATVTVNALTELLYSSSSVANMLAAGLITGLAEEDVPRWESLFTASSPASFKNFF